MEVFLILDIGLSFFLVFLLVNKKSKKEITFKKEIKELEEKLNRIKLSELKEKKRRVEGIKWNEEVQAKFNERVDCKPNKSIKVIIGDYHDGSASLTNCVLRKMGIETEVVPTASDIVERVQNGNSYDLIITNNFYSNGEKGQQVLDILKKEEKINTPIIILTIEKDSRDYFIKKGFDEYIEKPLNEEKVKGLFPMLIRDLAFISISEKK